ncbi:MAG: aminotransferase class I/II-fold pyridoxal phosphate-dependent enzyme [Frankiaceae bacterium]
MVPTQYKAVGRNARDIAASFESGIRNGALTPGDVLPSVRALASELNVAAGTAASAYRLMHDRGLVEARGRNGTRVSQRPPLTARSRNPLVPADVTDLAGGQPDPGLLPALSLLPRTMRGEPAAAPNAFVLPELLALGRERLAADGVRTEALTVASGGLDAIHRVLSAQLRPGDTVAVEDPGWPNALDLLAALGLRTQPVALDSHGPLPQPLRGALRAGARAVIITSRAQNPTGVVLTAERADELRSVLAEFPQTLLVEDDHAAELAGVPLASLAGVTDFWAFVRSTSKPYGPDLRLALVAGDDATISRVDGRMRVDSGWVSTLLQRLVIELWTNAPASAVVAHAAETYDTRRRSLLADLAHRGIPATGDTGLNVWVPVADETATVTKLLQARWAVAPGARFRLASPPGVRITVSALTTSTIPRLADDVASALTDTAPQHYTT